MYVMSSVHNPHEALYILPGTQEMPQHRAVIRREVGIRDLLAPSLGPGERGGPIYGNRL